MGGTSLKVLVDLTDKGSGVLSYTIKNLASKPVATAPPPALRPIPTPARLAPAKPQAPVAKPPSVPVKFSSVPVVRPPAQPALVRRTSFVGTNGALTLSVNMDSGAGKVDSQAIKYRVTVALTGTAQGKTYTLDTAQTSLRVKNVPLSDFGILKGSFPVGAAVPFRGTLEVPKRVLAQTGPKVLMFVVIEADTATGAATRKYVGVILK